MRPSLAELIHCGRRKETAQRGNTPSSVPVSTVLLVTGHYLSSYIVIPDSLEISLNAVSRMLKRWLTKHNNKNECGQV